MLHLVGDLFELNVKLRCQKVNFSVADKITTCFGLCHRRFVTCTHTSSQNIDKIQPDATCLMFILQFFFLWRCDPMRVMASSFTRFLDHTQRRTTVGRTPLDEWSARHRDLYLTTYNTHNRQTSMPPGGIRTHDLSRRTAADLRLRPRGHLDRHITQLFLHNLSRRHVSALSRAIFRLITFLCVANNTVINIMLLLATQMSCNVYKIYPFKIDHSDSRIVGTR